MQFLGVDKLRTKDPNFLVDTVIRFVQIFEDDYDYVLIGDCRFESEIKRWKDENYRVFSVHVKRPGFINDLNEKQRTHLSETSLDNFVFGAYLKARSIEELEDEIAIKLLPLLHL